MDEIQHREPEMILPGFVVRHTMMADLETVTDLMLVCERADYGSNEYARQRIRNEVRAFWEAEGMNLARNAWVVLTPDGLCVGRTNLWFPPHEPQEMYASPRVHPDYQGLGIGTALITLAEQRARELMVALSPDRGVRLNSWVEGVDECAGKLLEARGFTALHYYWRMELSMQESPSMPDWPQGMSVRTMIPGEERKVFEAYEDAFRDHWGYTPDDFADWSYWSFREGAFDPGLWWLALDGNEITGFALCRFDKSTQTGIIDDLGVRRPWRRRGLARALLQQAFGEFYKREVTTCALSVDSENLSGATRLYERAGMRRGRRVDIRYAKALRNI